jgi:hypothetical protein
MELLCNSGNILFYEFASIWLCGMSSVGMNFRRPLCAFAIKLGGERRREIVCVLLALLFSESRARTDNFQLSQKSDLPRRSLSPLSLPAIFQREQTRGEISLVEQLAAVQQPTQTNPRVGFAHMLNTSKSHVVCPFSLPTRLPFLAEEHC